MLKLCVKIFFFVSLAFFITSCLEDKNEGKKMDANSKSQEVKKEEDCDEDAAKKTLEKIKAEEYSLTKQNDAGCSTEVAKPIEIPTK